MTRIEPRDAPPSDAASREEARLTFDLMLAAAVAEGHLSPEQIDAFLEVGTSRLAWRLSATPGHPGANALPGPAGLEPKSRGPHKGGAYPTPPTMA